MPKKQEISENNKEASSQSEGSSSLKKIVSKLTRIRVKNSKKVKLLEDLGGHQFVGRLRIIPL